MNGTLNGGNRRVDSRSTDRHTHETAVRLAVQCRASSRRAHEEEWGDADPEFYVVIRDGLEQYRKGDESCSSGTS